MLRCPYFPFYKSFVSPFTYIPISQTKHSCVNVIAVMTIKLRKTYLEPYQKVETCTDPCGLNRSDEAASTAADDD